MIEERMSNKFKKKTERFLGYAFLTFFMLVSIVTLLRFLVKPAYAQNDGPWLERESNLDVQSRTIADDSSDQSDDQQDDQSIDDSDSDVDDSENEDLDSPDVDVPDDSDQVQDQGNNTPPSQGHPYRQKPNAPSPQAAPNSNGGNADGSDTQNTLSRKKPTRTLTANSVVNQFSIDTSKPAPAPAATPQGQQNQPPQQPPAASQPQGGTVQDQPGGALPNPDMSSFVGYLDRMQALQRSNLMLKMQIDNIKLMQDYANAKNAGMSGLGPVSPRPGGSSGDDTSLPSVLSIVGLENNRKANVFIPGYGTFLVRSGQAMVNGWTVTNVTRDSVFVDTGSGKTFALPFK